MRLESRSSFDIDRLWKTVRVDCWDQWNTNVIICVPNPKARRCLSIWNRCIRRARWFAAIAFPKNERNHLRGSISEMIPKQSSSLRVDVADRFFFSGCECERGGPIVAFGNSQASAGPAFPGDTAGYVSIGVEFFAGLDGKRNSKCEHSRSVVTWLNFAKSARRAPMQFYAPASFV